MYCERERERHTGLFYLKVVESTYSTLQHAFECMLGDGQVQTNSY